MNTRRLPLMVVAGALTQMVRRGLAAIQDVLINLTYFGWRPSVVYLSGKRRQVNF